MEFFWEILTEKDNTWLDWSSTSLILYWDIGVNIGLFLIDTYTVLSVVPFDIEFFDFSFAENWFLFRD